MSYPTDRVILFDRAMNPLPELSSSEVFSRVRSEGINAEHELVVVTTRRLEEGWRALTVDGTGKWHEWVVTEPDEVHQSGNSAIGTYRFVWSLQYDLTASYAHVDAASIGLGSSMTSQQVAAKVLEGVARWTVGDCDAPDIADGDGVVFIYESAWSKLSKAIGVTGWEVDAEIEVSNLYGVTARKLCLLGHMGSTEATRRFDWGEDVSEIKRTPDPGPYYCRVVPLGKGETEYADDDETTFEWPMDITEETGSPSLYYIEDAEAAAAFRMPDGNGGWWYPTKAVSYDEDDPELLLAAAQDDLLNHTRPNVSYEATVAQFAEAGLDAHGVALGDDIQIVDRGFNPDAALRLHGRVIKIELDELSPESTTVLTIGNLSPNMSSTLTKSLASLTEKQAQIASAVAKLDTATYVRSLLDRLNQEINATGGYGYLVEGEGFITYDVAVSDPLIGTEATQVVQIKGGSIRIANSKKSSFAGIDDWNWKTVFSSGLVATEVLTANNIITGMLSDATGKNYWDLDSSRLVMTDGYIGDSEGETYWDLANGVFVLVNSATNTWGRHDALKYDSVTFTEPTGWLNAITSSQTYSGLTLGYISGNSTSSSGMNKLLLIPNMPVGSTSSSTTSTTSAIMSNTSMKLMSYYGLSTSSALYRSGIRLGSTQSDWNIINSRGEVFPGITLSSSGVSLGAIYDGYSSSSSNSYSSAMVVSYNKTTSKGSVGVYGDMAMYGVIDIYNNSGSQKECKIGEDSNSRYVNIKLYGSANVQGSLQVHSTKSRVAETEHYGERLLYSYETPTPLFGDVGSSKIGDDGITVVQVDDIFSETTCTGNNYQVFLQKCGNGDLWVSYKNDNYFIVEGTPGLAFDWEIKARQLGYESLRMEDYGLNNTIEDNPNSVETIESCYIEDMNYISSIESLY